MRGAQCLHREEGERHTAESGGPVLGGPLWGGFVHSFIDFYLRLLVCEAPL